MNTKKKAGLTCAILFLLASGIYSYLAKSQSNSVAFFWPKIIPNVNTMTEYYFRRWIPCENITLPNGTVTLDNHYWVNSTTNQNSIYFHNWFDDFGLWFETALDDTMTFYCGALGEPNNITGTTETSWNAGTDILTLNVTASVRTGVHWDTQATVKLSNPDIYFYHSTDSERNYQTIYGFGIMKGGYWQYGFTASIFCEHGREDIQTVRLTLGDNQVSFIYTDSTHAITEIDPQDLCQIATEWYEEHRPSAWVTWDETNSYLHVGFNIRFIQLAGNESIPHYWYTRYTPRMTHQNTTVTVTSVSEGAKVHTQQRQFYIGEARLAYVQPVQIAWNLSYILIGFGGLFTVCFSFLYGGWKIRHGEVPEGLSYGLMLFIIGMGLVIVWLWR